ncbi:MAG: xylose isomerase [Verrucomicrobia bacterium Tous-C9LFEB]|nr:MAG: xylose isomerase [Verrucomicrobia bacterium Tous-C9LFEB]
MTTSSILRSEGNKRSALKQSFSWWCFANRGLDADTLLHAAREIGYEGVDLIDEALWPKVIEHGLKIVAVCGHNSIEDGMNRRENSKRIEAEVRANLAKAEQWKIPLLICFSGNRQGTHSGIDATAEVLNRLAPVAANAGVTLAIELLNSKVDHANYECDHTAWGVEVCRRVNSPSVKLLYDIYHMQVMEGDVIRTIQNHSAEFAHYHTAGNPGRGQPDERQELNYPAIYQAIAATNYRGYIGHEFLPTGDVRAALSQAFADCQQMP